MKNQCKLNCLKLLVTLSLLLCPLLSHAANIKHVEIKSSGSGVSLHSAVNSALLSAIAQVHGKSIESEKISVSMEASITTKNDEAYLASEGYLEKIKEKTKGAISSYRILTKEETNAGNWLVTLSVMVAQYKKSKSSERMRLVITPFTTESNDYVLNSKKVKAKSVTKNIAEQLSTFLVQTRKFAILDRTFTKQVNNELSNAKAENVHIDESARLGQKLVADFVLVGSISAFNYSTTTKKMRTSDKKYTVGHGMLAVNYKVIDTATQQVVFADTANVKVTHKDLLSVSVSDKKAIMSFMANKLAKKLSIKIQNQLFPLAIISNDGQQVILSQGGNSLAVGEKYKVYKTGEKLYDPYTKEFLGREESYFCDVTIIRVNAKQSYGEVSNTISELPLDIAKKTYILREKVKTRPVRVKKNRRKEKKSKQDDNW